MSTLIIGNAVTTIGYSAFQNCSSLTSLTTHTLTPPTIGNNTFGNVPTNIPVYIPCLTHDSYSTATGWRNFTNLTQADIYSITLTTAAGCDSIVYLILDHPISPMQSICMISVNEDNHNIITWKKPEEIVSYNIYREGAQSENYELVANVPYNSPNMWVDAESSAQIRSYRYKISGIDTCGVESVLSEVHKTMHLTINSGVGNSWNLIWTAYEGASYSTYNIYRSSGETMGELELIGTMPAGNTSFSDFSAPQGYVYYGGLRIEIAGQARNDGGIRITNVEVFDVYGRKLLSPASPISPETTIDISHLPAGVYFVKINTEAGQVVRKVVKE